MDKIEFGINYKHIPDGKVAMEDVYLAKISGADFFLKEVPDSTLLTREQVDELVGDAYRAGVNMAWTYDDYIKSIKEGWT